MDAELFELIKSVFIVGYVGGSIGIFMAYFQYGALNPYVPASNTFTNKELLQVLMVSMFWPIFMIYDIISKKDINSK